MSAGGGQGNWGPWPVQERPTGVLPGQVKVTSGDANPGFLSDKMMSSDATINVGIAGGPPQEIDLSVKGVRDTTGGGTTLPITTIPDGVTNDTVLIRPEGVAGVRGVSADLLRVYKERYLPFCLTNLNPIDNGGYLLTSDPGNLSVVRRDFPLGVTATQVRLLFHVDANDLVTNLGTGLMSFQFYKNGTLTNTVTAQTDVAADTIIDSGFYTLLGGVAPTDKWAVSINSTGTYTSGGITLSGGLIVGYTNLE